MIPLPPQVAAAGASGDLMFGTVDSWLVWNLTGGLQGGRWGTWHLPPGIWHLYLDTCHLTLIN